MHNLEKIIILLQKRKQNNTSIIKIDLFGLYLNQI